MKNVVITGATSGLGNLLVKEYIEDGCRVFAGYRNVKLKHELGELSENVIPFYLDMQKKWSIAKASKFITEQIESFGDLEKVDVLINAAGCVYAGAMECLNVDKIREQFEVNTFAHLEFTQGLLEKLEGGKIINISSMASFGIFPFIAPYCASKRALDILFNSMLLECNKDIKVISIKPGAIRTPFWEKGIENNKEEFQNNEKYEREFEFLKINAEAKKHEGLDPQKVVDFIMQIEGSEKPKSSYTIGFDAKCTEILSRFPQDWINSIVKKSFQERCNKL